MNAIDLIAVVYTGISVARGRRRGLADESYRLLRMGVAFGAGCGLYGLVSGALGHLLSLAPAVSGPVGFAGTVGGAWLLLRALKKRLTVWIAARFAPQQEVGGMIAGGLRALVLTMSVLATGVLAGGGGLVATSWLARIARFFVE